jgi:uncharacterized protein
MTNSVFERLADEQTVALTTFRKDGTGVPTAVNVVVRGDHAYFRTWNTTGKARRLARNPLVEIAPSTFRGKATGEPIRANARLLDDKDPAVAWVKRALPKKNKLMQPLVPFMHRLAGKKTLYYELSTDE